MNFYKLHKFLTLIVDVMIVNGTSLLINLSRKTRFVTVYMYVQHSNALNKRDRYIFTRFIYCTRNFDGQIILKGSRQVG